MTLHPAEQRYREAMARVDGDKAQAREEREKAIRAEAKVKPYREVAVEFGVSYQRVSQILSREMSGGSRGSP